MSDSTPLPPIVLNADDAAVKSRMIGAHWGATFKPLTPGMRPRGGALAVNRMCVPPGRAAVPFHAHLREDEVFYILSGEGILRYGDEVFALRAGDCVSCPAGTGIAHQIANTSDTDLVYLAIGDYDPHEVCTYPDTGKVLVRGIGRIGSLEDKAYMDGELDTPAILSMKPTAD